MWITSLNGSISVVQSKQDVDQLLIKARHKNDLSRLFDEKRINQMEGEEAFQYYALVCKQEFADTMIKMIKEIDYSNFEMELLHLNSELARV